MKHIHLLALAAMVTISGTAFGQYAGWKNRGSLFLNTTPDGANLPATARVEEFPLLVRLQRDFFRFAEAKPNGDDIRFSSKGVPLAYQIEQWDAAEGTASIWVRMPMIAGNARQEITMHWGKEDAVSESRGSAVFNESNGFRSVWHMGDSIVDETGTLESRDGGTTPVQGMIGKARRFTGRQGVFGGDKITNYPMGNDPHSTEVWFRAAKPNTTLIGWGNEKAQGKVVMQLRSPPHVRMDCYFSRGNVSSLSSLPLGEWTQVIHTYEQGESRIYVNGMPDGANTKDGPPLAIQSPARLWIGGWYHNYDFAGDLDEVRVSKVARSPEWVKLQYENQKPMQTLVGPVVAPAGKFAVSPGSASIMEGTSATFSAQANGAQKLYWVVKQDGKETVAAVDRFQFSFEAGRVTGNRTVTLVCKAIYPHEVKTQDIAITIVEAIEEPVFTLSAPTTWDGRRTIEVVPQVANRTAVQASGAGELKMQWRAEPLAVIKQEAPGRLILHRAQGSGKLTVTAMISNGGAPISRSVDIAVTEPKGDPWVERKPSKDEKPVEGQFYARDDKGGGTLHYNGTLAETTDSVFLRLYADEKLIKTETAEPGADNSYALSVRLKPGLIKYRVEFGTGTTVRETVGNIVCGDAYLISGQSNALATDTREQSPPETNEWIRSYGQPPRDAGNHLDNLWCLPVWKAQQGEKAELGWWGMELAKRMVESQKVPIFIINGAVGGTRIDQHQRNPAVPADLTTIYGRMLWRVQQAKLTHGIRGILWHQGENDQGADGPTGGYGWETYQPLFISMAAGWKTDFPNVQHYYVFQIWPNACSMGGRSGSGDMLRERQRTLPASFSNLHIMSTLGVRPPGGCHFPLAGWAEFARLIHPLMERDHYGKAAATHLTPPNLLSASLLHTKDTVELEFDQPVMWTDSLAGQFYLAGEKGRIASGSIAGNVLTLRLTEPSAAKRITYLKEVDWSQDRLLYGTNGIAALTFCEVPLVHGKIARQ